MKPTPVDEKLPMPDNTMAASVLDKPIHRPGLPAYSVSLVLGSSRPEPTWSALPSAALGKRPCALQPHTAPPITKWCLPPWSLLSSVRPKFEEHHVVERANGVSTPIEFWLPLD
jgi:hypothetical protein